MKISLFIASFFIATLTIAQDEPTENSNSDGTPKYSNEFLNIGVGAEALGMSSAFAASSGDVYSGYWNPAGLLNIDSKLEVGLMHSEYFAGIAKYDYLGIAKPIDDKSAAGFSILRFGVDDIPNTTQLIDAQGNINYDRITTFSAADYAFIFSYARKLKKTGLSFGGNAKIIYRNIGDFANAFGFGIDAAINYDYKKWKFSAVGKDITTTVNSWNTNLDDETEAIFELTGNDVPGKSLEVTLPRITLAAQRKFQISEKINVITELDLIATTDGKRNTLISANPVSVAPVFGFNFGYKDALFVRGGIGNFQQVTSLVPVPLGEEFPDVPEEETSWTFQPNFGIGLKLKQITLDYALTDIGNVSDALYSNVFSVKIAI